MVEPMKALKRLAIERGHAPKGIASALDSFRKTGKVSKAAKAQRKKLGLPDVSEAGVEELQAVLDDDTE